MHRIVGNVMPLHRSKELGVNHQLARNAVMGFVAMLLSGCATVYSDRHVSYCMEQSLISAQDLVKQGKLAEAYQLASAMQKINKDYPGLAGVVSNCAPKVNHDTAVSFLGGNIRKRAERERSIPAKVALYFPDRVLDLLDIVSFDIHFGGGIQANAHATRAVQLGAGLRSVGGIGWHDNRSLGVESQREAGLSLLVLGSQAYSGMRAGTSGIQDVSDSIVGFHRPTDLLYQEYRDYWAVGASVTALFLGIDFDFHPIELGDFLGGLVCLDLCNDDFSHTRALNLNNLDRRLLLDLARIWKSKK